MATSSATAQPLRPDTEGDAASPVSGHLGGRIAAGRLAEDVFLIVTPTLDLNIHDVALAKRDSQLFDTPQVHDLRLHLEVPLYFEVADRAPQQPEGAVRRQHWDEPSEYIRALRWVQYGAPYDGIYIRGGELPDVRIGHRSIVDAYSNALDSDHFQWGVQHNLNTVYGGVETFVDDVTDPDVMALRLYLRPWALHDRESIGRRFAVGVTLAGDQAAPTAVRLDPSGTRFEPDSNRDPVVTDTSGTALLGWDAEYQLVTGERVSITPYTDVNTQFARGTGWHSGAFFGFKLTDTIVLDLRAEYRMLGGRYEPAYLGRLYEVERVAYRPIVVGDAPAPKFTYTGAVFPRRRNGYAAELGLNVADRVFISGGWSDQTGGYNHSAWAEVRIPALSIVQLGASYVNTRFQGPEGLFDLDNAYATVEARVSPLPWLYVDAQATRRWETSESGRYHPVDDWSAGAGVSFGF